MTPLLSRRRSRRSKFLVLLFVALWCGATIVFAFSLIRRPPDSLLVDITGAMPCECRLDTLLGENEFCESKVGFVFVAVTPVGAKKEIQLRRRYVSWTIASINALQGNGGWAGPIYVFTNELGIFSRARYRFPASISLVDGSLSALFNNSGWNMRLRNLSSESIRLLTKNRLAYKLWKTQALARTPCDHLFYIDGDVIATASIEPFVLESIVNSHSMISMFLEKGIGGTLHGKQEPYHTGVLAMNRERSEVFLQAWEEEICKSTRKGTRDQTVLNRMITLRSWESEIDFLNEKWFAFPTREMVENAEPIPLFLHITHFRRRKYETGIVDLLKGRLNLPQSLEFD